MRTWCLLCHYDRSSPSRHSRQTWAVRNLVIETPSAILLLPFLSVPIKASNAIFNSKEFVKYSNTIISKLNIIFLYPPSFWEPSWVHSRKVFDITLLCSFKISWMKFSRQTTQICINCLDPVWPDLSIYWTLGNFIKPLATINLPKSPTFLGNFCEGVKNLSFSSEISFGQLL